MLKIVKTKDKGTKIKNGGGGDGIEGKVIFFSFFNQVKKPINLND